MCESGQTPAPFTMTWLSAAPLFCLHRFLFRWTAASSVVCGGSSASVLIAEDRCGPRKGNMRGAASHTDMR